MAVKEMLIVFVYDLDFCKNEHDDPLKAIRYFHPSWVSEQQKLALCGQLMGLMNFCSEFELVDCISLQNGKFKIERFGSRFILAMGTDRNVQESLLQHRAELMANILRLYHNDINKIFEQFDDPKNFSDKLYHIFETYLPVLQYNSNLLQNVYKLYLPKSASNLFLDATQILENVTSRANVLGGMILYNNKVVATQFSIDLTKIIVATDPMRIKTTAEVAKNCHFHIPSGSQIIKIFITLCEYNRLQRHIKKVNDSTSLGIQNTLPLPFSIKKKGKEPPPSLLKRDKSLIFTHIPEEEALVDIQLSPVEKARSSRPNHLPLKLKTIPPESGIASIVSFDENDSYPDFIGKTSICCTPMTENKILTGPIQSIFFASSSGNTNINDSNNAGEEVKVIEQKRRGIERSNNNDKKKKEEEESTVKKKEMKKWENVYIPLVDNPFKGILQWKKKSCDDLFSVAINDVIEDDNGSEYKVYNTITDPFYPIFGKKKRPISKKLFDDFQSLFNPSNDDVSSKPLPPSTSAAASSSSSNEQKSMKMSNELKKKFKADPMIMKRSGGENKNSPNRILRNQKKKMLKLPIKSFSLDLDSGGGGRASTSAAAAAASSTASNCVASTSSNTSIFDSPSTKTKKYMGGLQLTPLMSKLTLLAMNENENFSSSDLPTPNYYVDTPVDNTNRNLFNRLSKVDEEKHDEETAAAAAAAAATTVDANEHMNDMKRVDLLVCGQQNMTLMVIVDENLCDHPTVQQMFEICVNRLGRLEQKLNDVINVTVDLKASEYSFMTFDNAWNVMQRSGAYDLKTTQLMHDNFTRNKNVSDIIIRTSDSMIYGHNSGDQEVFYQHAAKQQSGFLIPSEFTIISQAKRKLERDQSVVLL